MGRTAAQRNRIPVEPRDSPETPKIDIDELREKILRAHSHAAAIAESGDKKAIQALHAQARDHRSELTPKQCKRLKQRLHNFFADGKKIDPTKIKVGLVPVARRGIEEELFATVRKTWSLPYSKGYGRRLRYLVMDTHHEKIIGIVGLQSPPADLQCRDQLIDVDAGKKLDVVNAMLDAYTVGAVAPYNRLIGGKLVAGMLATTQVRQDYWRKYAGRKTQMLGRRLSQPLLAVTTTSAYGRSSIYNRLSFEKRLLAEPIGYTQGYGSLHLDPYYPEILSFLESRGLTRPSGFGHGPKIRWQNISVALNELGLSARAMRHGVARQVFLFRHADNLSDVCRTGATPDTIDCDAGQWAEYWLERWAVPRSTRQSDWKTCNGLDYVRQSIPNSSF